MKYLTVGTKEIREDLFRDIKDTDLKYSMKPTGGLWLTEFDENMRNYNRWVDFMLCRPNILFYKNRGNNPFVQPCSMVSLRSDSNLYVLHNDQTLDYLMKCFPYQGKFSYEELSKYYDGIFIHLESLYHGKYDKDVLKKFSSFDVSSLILFRPDCIDYYQSGEVNINPFDYESGIEPEIYKINIDKVKKRVLKKDE